MKKIKKFTAILFATLMLILASVPAFAVEVTPDLESVQVQPRAKLTEVLVSWEKVSIQNTFPFVTYERNHSYMQLSYVNDFSYVQSSKLVSTPAQILLDNYITRYTRKYTTW